MGVHLHPSFVLANRHEIEDEIERLIALLDHVDGDPDLEDGHDAEQTDENGGDCEITAMLPEYGIDQSKGPINAGPAHRAHHAAQAGLAQDTNGMWRRL